MELSLRSLAALCALLAFVGAATAAATEVEIETTDAQSSYIVHVAAGHAPRLPRRGLLTTRAYGSFLRDHIPVEMSSPAPRVLYSYSHAATGFAARLTGRQAAHLASSGSVLAVVPDVMQELHTTLTPSFLGLSPSSGLLPASNGATDVVIGVIDTGVYPEGRASFAADPSLPPLPPGKFRGGCVSGPSFNGSALCNNKLVGAKFFHEGQEAARGRALAEESESPLDTDGHGTHTAYTAAGSAVADAALFDYARGNAVGMAPGARIAVYKACWEDGCASSDILAAFDEAIADGVDVISVSLGDDVAPDFYGDTTAVGAFRAVSKGIVVSASAGNSGPHVHPATAIPFAAAEKIRKYISMQKSPTATIVFRGTVVGPRPPSPRMASFSSRGPNSRAAEIFKPDVTAPGVDILAAWTGANSPTELPSDTRRVQYNIISGTSMSCPHVSGIAALLRQARPEWRPAYNTDSAGGVIGDMSTGEASTPFARGAGQVDPGLVYDAGTEDYITFLCALGYTAEQVAVFGSSTDCSTRAGSSQYSEAFKLKQCLAKLSATRFASLWQWTKELSKNFKAKIVASVMIGVSGPIYASGCANTSKTIMLSDSMIILVHPILDARIIPLQMALISAATADDTCGNIQVAAAIKLLCSSLATAPQAPDIFSA